MSTGPPWLLSTLLVSAAAAACYANSLNGHFVFDDLEAVVNNEDVWPGISVRDLFCNDFWGMPLTHHRSHKSYRPFTVLSFRLDHWASNGLRPWGFHLTNVMLHCAVSVLSLLVYERLFGGYSPRAALLSALLFAVHPVHSEAVAGVVGRADLLCCVFYFLSFLLYHGAVHAPGWPLLRQAGLVVASLGAAFAAMLCKETGLTVIGLCSSYDVMMGSRLAPRDIAACLLGDARSEAGVCASSGSSSSSGEEPRRASRLRPLLWRQMALALTGGLLLLLRWSIMGFSPPTFQKVDNPASFADSLSTRMLSYNYVYALNAWLLVCPEWLCFDWSMGCVPLVSVSTDARLLAVVALWLVLAALLWRILCLPPGDYQRSITMAAVLTVVPFLPATNLFFRVGFVIAERVLYLPSAGFCMLVVLGCCRLLAAVPRARYVVGLCYVLLLLVFGVRASWRSAEWHNETSLFTSALAICPLNAKVHYNVAKNAADTGNKSYAIREYQIALRLNPEYDQAMNNLANILRDVQRLLEAEQLLRRALQLRPDFAAAWMNLGIVLSNMQRFREAEQSYITALQHRRNYPDCLYNLGNLYLEQQRYEDALLAWRNATTLKPSHTVAWSNMIIMLDNIGHGEQAELVAQQALLVLPSEPSLHFNLANVLGKSGRFAEAEKHFLEAIAFDHKNPMYHTNLGVLYHRWKKYRQAERHYRRALELNPYLQSALENMALLQRALARAGAHPTYG